MMKTGIVGFDLEQYNPGNLEASPENPISCAVTTYSGPGDYPSWFLPHIDWFQLDRETDTPATIMQGLDLELLIDHMLNAMDLGLPVVTWHGAAYDMASLAFHAPERARDIRYLTLASIDLHLLFMAVTRHRLGLKAAAAAVGSVKGGGEIEDGGQAMALWPFRWEDIIAYCGQDVQATIDVYNHLVEHGGFDWTSSKGKTISFRLPDDLRDPAKWTVGYLLRDYQWARPARWITEPASPTDKHFEWLHPSLYPAKLVPKRKDTAHAPVPHVLANSPA